MKTIPFRCRQPVPVMRWPEAKVRQRKLDLVKLATLAVMIILCGCVLTLVHQEYVRFSNGQAIIENYSRGDNRFLNWIYDRHPNPDFAHAAPGELNGLGWDVRGKSYTLISPCHVLSGHAEPPSSLTFWTGTSFVKRQVVKSEALVEREKTASQAGGPSLLTLKDPLPRECTPFPIACAESSATYRGLKLLVFARHGRVGTQTVKAVDHSLYGTFADPLLLTDVASTRVMYGDSNGSILTKINDGRIAVVGITFSFIASKNASGREAILNAHHLVQAHLTQLKNLGVPIETVSLTTPYHLTSTR